ncbi:hypothetical protein D3C72_1326350 [compost metagenome]
MSANAGRRTGIVTAPAARIASVAVAKSASTSSLPPAKSVTMPSLRPASDAGCAITPEPGTSASRTMAASSALRAKGPTISNDVASGSTPADSTRSCVGRIPASACTHAGPRTEPNESVPSPNAAKLAATAAPVPLLEPLALRDKR